MKQLILSLIILLSYVDTSNAQVLILSDQNDGVRYLSQDDFDGFYDRVNAREIAIQLKNDSLDLTDREVAVEKYLASYQDEVVSVNENEALKLNTLFAKIFESVNKLNEQLLPDTIRIIVVNGNHYGASTFFTRGHAIVTSRSSLANMPAEAFEHVMYHEVSHIISRYHPQLRDELYGHLGFQKIDKPLLILKDFYERMLYNPDGVKIDYAISLQMEDSTDQLFVPIIFTTADHFTPSKPAFFGYLNFQLLPIDPVNNSYFLRDLESCKSLNVGHTMKKYFERITMNTQYIIHPDELLADNFLYLFHPEATNVELDQPLLSNLRNSFGSYEN